MGYVKPTSAEDIEPETLAALVRLAGFAVRPVDAEALAAAVRDQLASVQSLAEIDLTDIAPALEFDPRWAS
jgi:hypothetical protein